MPENIFWSTLASNARQTGITLIQEIDFLMDELCPDALLDERARCLRECLKGEFISEKKNRGRILSKLDKDRLDKLSKIVKIQPQTLIDSGYELSQNERKHFEEAIGAVPSQTVECKNSDKASMPDEIEFKYSLFKHQRTIANKIIDSSFGEDKGCIVHMPTGSGKTRTAMWSICRLITEYNKRCCWITYNKTLITQAISEFQKAWYAKGEGVCRISYLTGEKESENIETADMIFASFGKLSIDSKSENRKYINMLAKNTDVIIIDEAHETQAEGRGVAIRAVRFANPGVTLIGLTATPGKSPRGYNEEDYDLADHFKQNKITLEIEGYSNPVNYLLDKGYLSKPKYFKIENTWGSDSLVEVMEIVRIVEKNSCNHKRTMTFCSSVDISRKCAALCNLIGIESFHVDGETPESARNVIRDIFNSDRGERMVLFNCNVLATGFDSPRTTLVLICRKVSSLVLLSQMIGRGLRGVKAGGTESVDIGLILDDADTESLSIASMFMNWEHLWSST